MTEFNKQQYFEDTDQALRQDDPKLSQNDNAELIKELSEVEQEHLVDELIAHLVESDDKEGNDNVADMIKYLRTLSANYKLTKMLEEEEEISNSETDASKDSSDTVAEKTVEHNFAAATEREQEEQAVETEGNASTQELEEGKSETN